MLILELLRAEIAERGVQSAGVQDLDVRHEGEQDGEVDPQPAQPDQPPKPSAGARPGLELRRYRPSAAKPSGIAVVDLSSSMANIEVTSLRSMREISFL